MVTVDEYLDMVEELDDFDQEIVRVLTLIPSRSFYVLCQPELIRLRQRIDEVRQQLRFPAYAGDNRLKQELSRLTTEYEGLLEGQALESKNDYRCLLECYLDNRGKREFLKQAIEQYHLLKWLLHFAGMKEV